MSGNGHTVMSFWPLASELNDPAPHGWRAETWQFAGGTEYAIYCANNLKHLLKAHPGRPISVDVLRSLLPGMDIPTLLEVIADHRLTSAVLELKKDDSSEVQKFDVLIWSNDPYAQLEDMR
jgi:hypothetical protein